MNKISKEKRTHIILVLMLTAGAIGGLWFGLISYQKSKLAEVAKKIGDAQQQLGRIKSVVTNASLVAIELKKASDQVNTIEGGMATGDLFSWMVSSLKQFNTPNYKVEMPQFGPPVETDTVMFPNYPYRQAVVAVAGTAYYWDFGKFLAELENHFPYTRVQNLTLEPAPSANVDEKEKLAFRMEVVALIKPRTP
jgi:hypothetical protein